MSLGNIQLAGQTVLRNVKNLVSGAKLKIQQDMAWTERDVHLKVFAEHGGTALSEKDSGRFG